MTPVWTPNCNLNFTAHDCEDLPAIRENGMIVSHWQPGPEELETLNAGGFVRLSVLGEFHPPICIDVEGA